MQVQTEQFEIEVIDESVHRIRSNDNTRQCAKEYLLGEIFWNAPRYGVTVKNVDGTNSSCVILANGGSTTVHVNSAVVIDDNLFIAIGNLICCLEIPSLALRWHQQVDMAACFGVYVSPDNKGIISHGEIEIAKIGFSGDIKWHVSGKDIFTEGFLLFPDHIETIDFNHEKYRIEISSGQMSLAKDS